MSNGKGGVSLTDAAGCEIRRSDDQIEQQWAAGSGTSSRRWTGYVPPPVAASRENGKALERWTYDLLREFIVHLALFPGSFSHQ